MREECARKETGRKFAATGGCQLRVFSVLNQTQGCVYFTYWDQCEYYVHFQCLYIKTDNNAEEGEFL